MSGKPDPTMNPPGVTGGFKQCVSRNGVSTCEIIPSNPAIPIVSIPVDKNLFAPAVFNVTVLINSTAAGLCEVLDTGGPTTSPTVAAPTFSPVTSVPTHSPTSVPRFVGLDLYVFLDSSKSIQWDAPSCRKAPGANPSLPDALVCWDLFMKFTTALVKNASEIHAPTARDPAFGWQGDRPALDEGVRVWIYGFACANQ